MIKRRIRIIIKRRKVIRKRIIIKIINIIRKITQKNFLKIRSKNVNKNQCRNSPHSIGNFPITPVQQIH